jgi:hypothetical protein
MGMFSLAKLRIGKTRPSNRKTKSSSCKPVIARPCWSTTFASTRVKATSLLKTTGSSAADTCIANRRSNGKAERSRYEKCRSISFLNTCSDESSFPE